MKEMKLKYGCNPNQNIASVSVKDGELPFEVLNGSAGYINLMDALNAWQLVRELKEATGLASAASFKHVSPAGAAVAVPLTDALKKAYFVENMELSDMATAYIRARGADRVASYGDFAALSDECDESTAKILANEVSDGIIAPSYSEKALEILKTKKKGNYLVMKINLNYSAPETEKREIFGITFEQTRNNIKIDDKIFDNIVSGNKNIPDSAKRDLLIATITLKYTQSNSVCYVKDGQATGIGAGQQARIHCTRLAGDKSDKWFLRQHEKVINLPFKPEIKRPDRDNAIDVYISNEYEDILNDWERVFTYKPEIFTAEEKAEWIRQQKDVCLASDAFFPFGDNIERAKKSGVKYIAETGGSIRDDNVIEVCNKYDMALAFTGIRLFHH